MLFNFALARAARAASTGQDAILQPVPPWCSSVGPGRFEVLGDGCGDEEAYPSGPCHLDEPISQFVPWVIGLLGGDDDARIQEQGAHWVAG